MIETKLSNLSSSPKAKENPPNILCCVFLGHKLQVKHLHTSISAFIYYVSDEASYFDSSIFDKIKINTNRLRHTFPFQKRLVQRLEDVRPFVRLLISLVAGIFDSGKVSSLLQLIYSAFRVIKSIRGRMLFFNNEHAVLFAFDLKFRMSFFLIHILMMIIIIIAYLTYSYWQLIN